ncbi:MAG: hypothetical protein KF789_04560 [Bdellovibrionaceae bacterium]|nr:hypothetical protein [Pseudobdellovibrionaceae bacterium]
MKVSGKKVSLMLGSLLAVSMMSATAAAETVCQDLWTVRALKAKHGLLLDLKEKGQQGPACDLVVESFNYDEADKSIALQIRPATFCPLEALTERRAQFVWMLPFELRTAGNLRLIVNNRETGSINIEKASALFEGGCK